MARAYGRLYRDEAKRALCSSLSLMATEGKTLFDSPAGRGTFQGFTEAYDVKLQIGAEIVAFHPVKVRRALA